MIGGIGLGVPRDREREDFVKINSASWQLKLISIIIALLRLKWIFLSNLKSFQTPKNNHLNLELIKYT